MSDSKFILSTSLLVWLFQYDRKSTRHVALTFLCSFPVKRENCYKGQPGLVVMGQPLCDLDCDISDNMTKSHLPWAQGIMGASSLLQTVVLNSSAGQSHRKEIFLNKKSTYSGPMDSLCFHGGH